MHISRFAAGYFLSGERPQRAINSSRCCWVVSDGVGGCFGTIIYSRLACSMSRRGAMRVSRRCIG